MNSENIFDAITDIREEIITEAKEHRFSKPRRIVTRWSTIAASLVLIIGIGGYLLISTGRLSAPGGSPGGAASGAGGAGRQEGSTVFMSYAGPVFPLSLQGDSAGISAERDISLDFNGFGTRRSADSGLLLYHNDIRVVDSYTLTNDAEDDKTVSIIYPFEGTFADLQRLQPTITIDGNELETGLVAGAYSGGFMGTGPKDAHLAINLRQVSSWEEYVALLSDGEYLKRAVGEQAALDQTVAVYEFSNSWANHDAAVNPTLAASFCLDYDRTTILSYGFHGASRDRESGFMRQSFSVPGEGFPGSGRSFYLIVVGDDITELNIQGYINGGCDAGDEMDEVGADVTRYEAILSDVIAFLLEDFLTVTEDYSAGDPQSISDSIYFAMLYRAAVEHLCEYGVLSENTAFRYDTGWLEEIFSETRLIKRVFYLTADIQIPAFGSARLKAEMIKPGSYDYYGAHLGNIGVYGYDMVITLGSGFVFDSLTASIAGSEWIEIVRQNFGFDPENDILVVTLDLDMPHYYIEVRGAAPGG